MENIEKNQEQLLELLKSSFGHYDFNENAFKLQVQFLFENLLEAGLVELTACVLWFVGSLGAAGFASGFFFVAFG